MPTWILSFARSRAFLGAGGGGFGRIVTAGRLPDQPMPNRNGELHIETCCAGDCDTPLPGGEGRLGVDDEYLCVNSLDIPVRRLEL